MVWPLLCPFLHSYYHSTTTKHFLALKSLPYPPKKHYRVAKKRPNREHAKDLNSNQTGILIAKNIDAFKISRKTKNVQRQLKNYFSKVEEGMRKS